MLCLNCHKPIEPTGTDQVIICDENTILRFTVCEACEFTNQLSYGGVHIVTCYEPEQPATVPLNGTIRV